MVRLVRSSVIPLGGAGRCRRTTGRSAPAPVSSERRHQTLSSARKLLRALVLTGLSVVLVAPAAAARAQPSESELTARISKSSEALEDIVESYNGLNEEIKATKASVAELSRQLGPMEEQLEQRRAEIGVRRALGETAGSVAGGLVRRAVRLEASPTPDP